MKPIRIQISDDTEASSAINSLNDQIPETTKNSPEFTILYPQVAACIEDFSGKAKKLAKAGTTIHIQKEFTFPDANVLITLEYPRKLGFLERLLRALKRE